LSLWVILSGIVIPATAISENTLADVLGRDVLSGLLRARRA
jgi:hypothetical protein